MDVIITIDFDHIGCNSRNYEMNEISFDYEAELNTLQDVFSSRGINNLTSFVRIDNQIKDVFGNYQYVLNLLRKTKLQSELAWHPHLYAKSDKYYVLTDPAWAIKQLWDIYHANPIIREMKSVRIGGAMMDNDIMATLNNMNFVIDSTALPGSMRNDLHRKFDWQYAGNSAYHPSLCDYRCGGDPHHKIYEVPMSTIYIHAPYDRHPVRRYINPTMRKELFQPAFANLSHYLSFVVIVFHPDQLMSGYSDDLYEYGFNNFVSNLDFIIEHLGDVKFKTMRQFYG